MLRLRATATDCEGMELARAETEKIFNVGRSNFTNPLQIVSISPRRVCCENYGGKLYVQFSREQNKTYIKASLTLGDVVCTKTISN